MSLKTLLLKNYYNFSNISAKNKKNKPTNALYNIEKDLTSLASVTINRISERN